MEGGADSGFRHVQAEEYKSRLFHFCGTGKNVVMSQVPAIHDFYLAVTHEQWHVNFDV